MTRRGRQAQPSGHRIMLVDDNPDYLQATRLLLERDGHEVITATNGREALGLLPKHRVDLLLLDYFMPGMTGEQVVTELRKFDPYVQVILQTGYASEQPPQELLRRLDIQGYYDKTEGPDQLLMWTAVGLKAARTIQSLNKSREGLREILDATPELQRLQPLAGLLSEALHRVGRLLAAIGERGQPGAAGATDAFIAIAQGDDHLKMAAGIGVFAHRTEADLAPHAAAALRRAFEGREVVSEAGVTVIPVRLAERSVGALYLGRDGFSEEDLELLSVLANQFGGAIQNARLFELLDADVETGMRGRSFFDEWLLRSLKTALRHRDSLGIALCAFAPEGGDDDPRSRRRIELACTSAARAWMEATRAGDVVARFASDTFAIIAPHGNEGMLGGLARRWREIVVKLAAQSEGAPLPLHANAGYAILAPPAFAESDLERPIAVGYFVKVRDAMVRAAEAALREAQARECSVFPAMSLKWPLLPQ